VWLFFINITTNSGYVKIRISGLSKTAYYIIAMSNKKELPELAKNIREFRQREGLSQAQLGEKISYSQQIVNAYESGQRVPPPATLKTLADHFKTSIDVLVGKRKIKITGTPSKVMQKLKVVENLPPKEQKKVVEYAELLVTANGKH